MSPEIAALVRILRVLYTEEEAFQWLISPQPLFDGAVALDMIAQGKAAHLTAALQGMVEGVYL